MKAVILVGGEGTRLRPLTCNTPKPMVPILNRPFLEHMIDYLKGHGVSQIILAMGYLPDRIQAHFGDGAGLGVELTYVIEDSPLGTAGAVKNVEALLDDTFIVCNGDILTDVDLTNMVAYHRSSGAKATIALTEVEDPTRFGVVETQASGRVRRFIEKPSWDAVTSHWINAGTYILEPAVLALVPQGNHHMFEQGLFPALLRGGEPVFAYPSNGYWIDIGTPQKYLEVHHDLLLGRTPHTLLGPPTQDNLWIGPGCHIDPTAHFTGPVVLGTGCRLEAKVRISGPAVLGDGCQIGAGSIVEEAVIWPHTQLGRQVMVRRSVIADHCQVEDECWLVDGAILGDRVVLGAGNKLERGIRIWSERKIAAETITF